MNTPKPWIPYICSRPLSDMPEYIKACIENSGGAEFHMVAAFDERGQVDVAMVGNGPRGKFNAQLIAAAPDLLEALERCVAYMNGFTQHCASKPSAKDQAIAALTKAKGGN